MHPTFVTTYTTTITTTESPPRRPSPLLPPPIEIEHCSQALKSLGARLRVIDRPEARLLYAAMLTSRSKLSHAVEQGHQGQWEWMMDAA
jgi:hypothetical protein